MLTVAFFSVQGAATRRRVRYAEIVLMEDEEAVKRLLGDPPCSPYCCCTAGLSCITKASHNLQSCIALATMSKPIPESFRWLLLPAMAVILYDYRVPLDLGPA